MQKKYLVTAVLGLLLLDPALSRADGKDGVAAVVNGENITKGRFAPYISNPDDVLYYDRYEVAKKLHAGENVIALVLGNGFLNNPDTSWQFWFFVCVTLTALWIILYFMRKMPYSKLLCFGFS